MSTIEFPFKPRRDDPTGFLTVQQNLEALASLFLRGTTDGDVLVWDAVNSRYKSVPASTVGAPVGVVSAFAGSSISVPTGYLLCDGSAVNRITYAALFAVISTTYGVGDGSTTFNLPDLRGRVPVGLGSHVDVDTLGETEGAAVGSRRPAHSHDPASLTVTGAPSIGSLAGTIGSLATGAGTLGVAINDPGHAHTYTGTAVDNAIDAIDRPAGTDTGGGTATLSVSSATTGVTGSVTGSPSLSGTPGISGAPGLGTLDVGGTIGAAGLTDEPAYIVLNYIIKT